MSEINNPGGNEVPENQPPAAPPPPSAGSAGGTPPPPPPAPPTGGLPQPAPDGGANYTFTVGNAFNWGWLKFQQNFAPIALAALIYVVGAIVLTAIFLFILSAIGAFGGSTVSGTTRYDPETGQMVYDVNTGAAGFGFFAMAVLIGIGILVGVVYFAIVQAGIVRGCLAIADGKRIELKDLFPGDKLKTVIIAGIIVGAMTGVGYILCYIPGIIVAFFSAYYVYFILDKNLDAWESVKASWSFVNRNLGTLIIFYIASAIAYFIGSLLCGIGLIFVIPIVLLAQVYAFRVLNKEDISPAVPTH